MWGTLFSPLFMEEKINVGDTLSSLLKEGEKEYEVHSFSPSLKREKSVGYTVVLESLCIPFMKKEKISVGCALFCPLIMKEKTVFTKHA